MLIALTALVPLVIAVEIAESQTSMPSDQMQRAMEMETKN
jgi:hypothetical protein